MKTRILVALIALPFVLVPIWLGGLWFLALMLVIAALAGYEFYNLMDVGGYRPNRWIGYAWLAALIFSAWQPALAPISLVLTVGLIVTMSYALWQVVQPANTWMSTGVVAIYLGVMAGQSLALRVHVENGLWWFLFAVLMTWANDTVAYFAGVTLGRRKLWPRLSPKKTWEGTIGGWIGAAICGGLFAWFAPLGLSVAMGVLVGFVAGVLALLGDLSISMLKRQVGIKDSGGLFPGHGGMLDRLDSILFVVPFVYQVSLLS